MEWLTFRGVWAYESGGLILPFGRGRKLTDRVLSKTGVRGLIFPSKSNSLRITDSILRWLLLTFRVQRAQTLAESLKPYGGTDTNVSVSE